MDTTQQHIVIEQDPLVLNVQAQKAEHIFNLDKRSYKRHIEMLMNALDIKTIQEVKIDKDMTSQLSSATSKKNDKGLILKSRFNKVTVQQQIDPGALDQNLNLSQFSSLIMSEHSKPLKHD